MARILKLNPIVANQIAAGEVIERPASVIKECVENSLDANSRGITIETIDSGKQLIRLTDDGAGIDKDDLSLALTAHATSKLKQLEDLESLMSLGFRGEALASIAAVSQLEVISKTHHAKHAYAISNQQDFLKPKIKAHPNGTSITINNLFCNAPVRLKFLKAKRTEDFHIERQIKALALSHFNIGFKWIKDNLVQFNCPPITDPDMQGQRVADLLGQRFLKHAYYFSEKKAGITVQGWLLDPEHAPNQSDWQYCFLNQRWVKDPVLKHAITQAFEAFLHPGKQAGFILHITMQSDEYDVNVHPCKFEVRFNNARKVHDTIYQIVYNVLANTIETVEDNTAIELAKPQAVSKPLSAMQSIVPTVSWDDSLGKVLTLTHQRYLICEHTNALALIDCERLFKHFLQQQLKNFFPKIIKQPLLEPIFINANHADLKLFSKNIKLLSEWGFDCDIFSESQIIVRMQPALLNGCEIKNNFLLALKQLSPLNNSDGFLRELLQKASFSTMRGHDINAIKHWIMQAHQIGITLKSFTKMITLSNAVLKV